MSTVYGQEKVLGMVLSATNYGEYDKRLVILTKEYGKITVFSKGARKPGNQFMGCSQAFVFGSFTLYCGRSSYTLNGAEVSNYFEELREDVEAMYYGFYFCEYAQYLTRENVPSNDILLLLYQSMRMLIKKTISFRLVRVVFELKILAYDGQAPYMHGCIRCRKEEPFLSFSIQGGGVLCDECRKKYSDIRMLQPGTAHAMRYVTAASVKTVYDFDVKESILEQLEQVMVDYQKKYVSHEFNSLPILESFIDLKMPIEKKTEKG